jgi:hypothetical protein
MKTVFETKLDRGILLNTMPVGDGFILKDDPIFTVYIRVNLDRLGVGAMSDSKDMTPFIPIVNEFGIVSVRRADTPVVPIEAKIVITKIGQK